MMRKNHLMGGTKPEGFIVRRSEVKAWQIERRTLSVEEPVPNNTPVKINEQKKTSQYTEGEKK